MKKLLFVCLACVLSCGDGANNDAHANHGNHANHDHNHHDAEVDTYVDGLTKTSAGGLKVSLTADPGPPDVGDSTWTIRVVDADDAAVDGATVTLTPFMPGHGHGTNPADYTGTFTSDGTYEIGPFDLFMPGVWETSIKIDAEDVVETVVYVFELEG